MRNEERSEKQTLLRTSSRHFQGGPNRGCAAIITRHRHRKPRYERNRMRRFAAVLLIFNLIVPSLAIGAEDPALVGYSPRSSQTEREWEGKLRAIR